MVLSQLVDDPQPRPVAVPLVPRRQPLLQRLRQSVAHPKVPLLQRQQQLLAQMKSVEVPLRRRLQGGAVLDLTLVEVHRRKGKDLRRHVSLVTALAAAAVLQETL